MTKSEVVEKIRAMPVPEQLALAETILHDLGMTERLSTRDRVRRQMAESAKEALEYYRTDLDVALWHAALEGGRARNRVATSIREVSVDGPNQP